MDKAVMYEPGRKSEGARLRAMAVFIVQDLEDVPMTSLATGLNRDLSSLSRAGRRRSVTAEG